MKKISLIAILAGACLLASSLAWGASSRNEITMTWNNPGSSNLSTGTMQSSSWASANPGSGVWASQIDVPGGNSSATDAWGNSYAHGQTTTTTLSAYSEVILNGDADARASRGEWYYVVNGASDAFFNLSYVNTIQNVDNSGGSALGNLWAWGQILDANGNSLTGGYVYGANGNLQLTSAANTGDWIYLQAGVGSFSEASAVPLPGAIWLMGSGLLSLLGFRKK